MERIAGTRRVYLLEWTGLGGSRGARIVSVKKEMTLPSKKKIMHL